MLREIGEGRLRWHNNGERIDGPNEHMRGECSGLRGECTGLRGNLDDCEISDKDRTDRVEIRCLLGGPSPNRD